jgi:uncharacterized membrane protein (UPF0127 family)
LTLAVPWLLREGTVLASAEVATTRRARRRGLLGRDHLEGVLLIEPARSVHTIGMRFPIDVAHLADDGTVLRTTTMPRHRIGRPVLRAAKVLEAEAGAFRHWELAPGQVLEIRANQDSG